MIICWIWIILIVVGIIIRDEEMDNKGGML
jgi:hypothetical protein